MNGESAGRLSISQCATLACLLEVNAPKPGNVHRGADFADATLNDFAASAVAIGPILEQASLLGVGQTVLNCVNATQRVTATNTNLGTILLLAPLAAVPIELNCADGVETILSGLNGQDACNVYSAIRLAKPGGMGDVESMDVNASAPASLLEAMAAAAERDAIAFEYANNYKVTMERVVPRLARLAGAGMNEPKLALPSAIVRVQIELLAAAGDSLIARKCGKEVNQLAMQYAQRVLDAGNPTNENYHSALSDFDFWLRSDGNRRNPGTTADLIAAGLFVCLRERLLTPGFG